MLVFDWFLLQGRIIKNSFRQGGRGFILKDAWHTLIILFGLAFFYIFLNVMFRFIDNKGFSSFDFAFILFSFSMLVFLPLLVYSAIVCSLSFFFQKEELHFYFSFPASRLSVFTVKFIQTYFHTNWMVFLGFLVYLAAIQSYFKTTLLIYLTGSISFLVFLLIPVCLAAMLVIIVSRFIPFVRSKGILTVIGLLAGSILLSAIRVMQPEQLVTAEGKMRLVTFVQNLYKPWMTALPSEWITNILFAQSQNNSRGVMINFLSLFILAFALLLMLYLIAEFFYKKSWADAVVASPAVKRGDAGGILTALLPAPLRGFIRKDLISFNRDTVEKGSLLLLIPLCFVYLYSMYVLNRHIQNANEEQIFSFLYIYLFNFFYASVVISALSGRWILPSVSSEGVNFKLIKGSMTSLKDFLRAKFFLGFIPLLALGEMLILCSSFILHLKLYFVLASAFTMGILCWGITLISLIVGIREADFTITSSLDFALSMRGLLCLTWQLAFVVAVLILAVVPAALIMYMGFSPHFIIALIISLGIILIISKIISHFYKSSLIELSGKGI